MKDWKKAVRQWYCKDAGIPLEDFETQLCGEDTPRKAVQND